MIQTSCSELLVDTKLYNVAIAYRQLKMLFDKFEMTSDPPISVALLKKLKENSLNEDEEIEDFEIMIYDKLGNRCWLEYGYNGYINTGFRFDTHCSDWDEKCFPIFKISLDNLKQSELYCCDGGKTTGYEEWEVKQ